MLPKEGIHGGYVEKFARKYGFEPHEVIDFSSNINPLPLPEEVREQYVLNFDTLRRYPDSEYYELRSALTKYTGYPGEWIMVGNGATELLYLVVRSLNVNRALLFAPSFTDYERSFYGTGCHPDLYRIKEELDFVLDMEAFLERLHQGYGMTIICNPNNPTGYLIPKQDLLHIIDVAKKHGTLVIIDETFIEFAPQDETASVLQEISSYDNVILIRALTKFFAVPGLRLGYCVAHPDLLEKIAPYKEPWTVNVLASVLGPCLLKNKDFISRTKEWIFEERSYFYKSLNRIEGLKVYQSSASFFLLKLLKNNWNVRMLQNFLTPERILIRDASSFPFLDESFFRLAIKDRRNNDRLLSVLEYVY